VRDSVILLMGPTATGKTALALELAERIGGEIISVDSALVYRGMDIGTAKPGAAELARVPHHLIDVRDPEESWSAADFVEHARRLIGEIQSRGHVPLLVGGTMLYFRALLDGLDPMPAIDPGSPRRVAGAPPAGGCRTPACRTAGASTRFPRGGFTGTIPSASCARWRCIGALGARCRRFSPGRAARCRTTGAGLRSGPRTAPGCAGGSGSGSTPCWPRASPANCRRCRGARC
jgi:hypothetical protein